VSPKRLPVVSGARVVRALEKDGFDVISTKGSHCKLRRGSRTVIVPLHDEVRPGTRVDLARRRYDCRPAPRVALTDSTSLEGVPTWPSWALTCMLRWPVVTVAYRCSPWLMAR
jgi:predicted RNA binding protein YcfA (HicA-like mRNA interferase family)